MIILNIGGLVLLIIAMHRIGVRIQQRLLGYVERNASDPYAITLVFAFIIGWLVSSFFVGGAWALFFWIISGGRS